MASNTCANLLSGNNKGSLLICDRRSQLRTALLSGKFETRATVERPPSRRRNRILFANFRDTDSCCTRRWNSSTRPSPSAIFSVDAFFEKRARRISCNPCFNSRPISFRSGKRSRAGCVFGKSWQTAMPNFHHTERWRIRLICLSSESNSVPAAGLPGFKALRAAVIRLDRPSRRSCSDF